MSGPPRAEESGCYLWTAKLGKDETIEPMVRHDGKMKIFARLICEEVNGAPPTPKHVAAHATPNGCVGGLCVNGNHLRWATHQENQLDTPPEERSAKGRRADVKMRGIRYSAIAEGKVTYFTGVPCANGHLDVRYSNGGCRTCINDDTRRRRLLRKGML